MEGTYNFISTIKSLWIGLIIMKCYLNIRACTYRNKKIIMLSQVLLVFVLYIFFVSTEISFFLLFFLSFVSSILMSILSKRKTIKKQRFNISKKDHSKFFKSSILAGYFSRSYKLEVSSENIISENINYGVVKPISLYESQLHRRLKQG